MAILLRKYGLDRRYNVNALSRKKSPVNQRPHVPGSRPDSRAPVLSLFGQALRAKQVFKRQFSFFRESQFEKIVKQSKKDKAVVQSLLNLSALRLVSVVHRTNWAATPWAAKQLISHGHIRVNGKKVTVGECLLSLHDVVTIRCFKNCHIQASVRNGERQIPDYLEIKDDKCKIIGHPSLNDSYIKADLPTIIESYR
jgi:small subunit ribosomal protein S4